jgi:hypothetical protein
MTGESCYDIPALFRNVADEYRAVFWLLSNIT